MTQPPRRIRRKDIFIATSSLDVLHTESVVRHLKRANCRPIIYEADKVLTGTKRFAIFFDKKQFSIKYEDLIINQDAVGAAWFRKADYFNLNLQDEAKQFYLEAEARELQRGIFAALPDRYWLSAPSKVERGKDKLMQLRLAQKVGFDIPTTVVSNNWEEIRRVLPPLLIMKTSRGRLYENNRQKGVFAAILNDNNLNDMRQTRPFPGIFQSYIPKAREWRVTVVGEEVFSAAVYTTTKAKDDYRKWMLTDNVEFRKERLPDEAGRKCVQLLKDMELAFGAFDLIEDERGKITFLEVNPNGQFLWLEEGLGLPISQAIASRLVDIANNTS